MQIDRRNRNKHMIKNWDNIVAKLKSKFLPKYYQLTLYRLVQNPKKREMTVREHIEEFSKVNLRVGYVEDTTEKTTKYLNGLRIDIQDEISLLSPTTMEEAYQYAMKEEEKNSGRGRGTKGKGKTTGRGKFSSQKNDVGNLNHQE